MFKEVLFWKDWNPLFKGIYFFLLVVFIASAVFFSYGYTHPFESIIPWQTINYIDKKAYSIFDISGGIFSIPIENYAYYVTQNYRASTLLVNFDAVNFFCIIMMIIYVFLFTVISYFKSWWYYLAKTLIIVSIAGLRLDLFMVYGDVRNMFVLFVLLSSVGLNVFFHFKRTETTFIVRLLSYFMLFTAYALIIANGSSIQNQQLYLTNYGLFAPLFVTLVFIILVAFDVEFMFLYFTTISKSVNPRSNTYNFMGISILYISNILLTLLRRLGVIDWDLFYFDEYLMLGLATLAGFWVYRRRLEATGSVIPFQPFGAFFYLLLASLTWATIGYAHATSNLSIIRAIREIILFSHFGIGFIFIIYVLYAYTVDLNKNLPVHDAVLRTSKGPIHYIRLGGLMIFIGLISTNYNLALDYLFAGYYSNIADVYMHERNYPLATQYYNKVAENKEFDFKRTLGMAAISEAYEKNEEAIKYYSNLHISFDCPQSYANEAYLYEKEGNFFMSLSVLKEGLAKYPKQAQLYLDLGNIFSKTKLPDSAYYYYALAEQNTDCSFIAKTNKISLAINNGFDLADSSLTLESTHTPLAINQLAYHNLKQIPYKAKYTDVKEKDEFWIYQVNFISNDIYNKDTALLNPNTRFLLQKDSTLHQYTEQLTYANALYAFARQEVNTAMTDIYRLKNFYPDNASSYANTLGIMTLVQKQADKAFEYFNESYEDRNPVGGMNALIALVEKKNKDEILTYSEKLINSTESSVRGFTKEITQYVNAPIPTNAEELIKYLNINKKRLSGSELLKLANSITDKGLQLTAYLLVQTEFIDRKDFELAKSINLNGLNVAQMSYKANLNALFILLNDKNYDEILKNIDQTKLNVEDQALKNYFRVLAFAGKGDTSKVKAYMGKMLESLPLYTDALLFAISYYESRGNIDKAYEVCANAITINNFNSQVKMKLCLLSVPKGLGAFVDKQLEELKHELSNEQYTEFMKKYTEAVNKQNEGFQW